MIAVSKRASRSSGYADVPKQKSFRKHSGVKSIHFKDDVPKSALKTTLHTQ